VSTRVMTVQFQETVFQKLSTGLETLNERAAALDPSAELVLFEVQKMLVNAQKAREFAENTRKAEAAPLREIYLRWKPVVDGFDTLIARLKQFAAPLLAEQKKQQVRGVKTETGSMTGVSVWRWELEDMARVPDDYLQAILDVAKIDKAIQDGVREIPGIKIFEDTDVVGRRAKKKQD